MSKILDAAGSDMNNVIKVTVYLAHIAKDLELMNEVYQEVHVYSYLVIHFDPLLRS